MGSIEGLTSGAEGKGGSIVLVKRCHMRRVGISVIGGRGSVAEESQMKLCITSLDSGKGEWVPAREGLVPGRNLQTPPASNDNAPALP